MTNPRNSPIPSITLQITKKDGERFLEACGELNTILQQQDLTGKPLHERLYDAVMCGVSSPVITQFLDRIKDLDENERKAATLIFHESDKTHKLRKFFDALGDMNSNLDRNAAISLLRTILTSITACLTHHENMKDIIVEGKPSHSPERPTKKAKLHHNKYDDAATAATLSTKSETEEDSSRVPCQSPSWDSSLATLRDEDDHSVSLRKEIEEIANYAARELILYASDENQNGFSQTSPNIDFNKFGEWYNKNGSSLVPWIELLQQSKWRASSKKTPSKEAEHSTAVGRMGTSPCSLATEDDRSRTLVSFDFNGSGSPTPLLINITEDNLHALQALVQRTKLCQRTSAEVCKMLLHAGCQRISNGQEIMVLRREDFRQTMRMIIPEYIFAQLNEVERVSFNEHLIDFFYCFEESKPVLHDGEVDLKEFAIGFCFLCAGNKSTKLATGFELMDSKRRGYLTEDQLLRYLQSYLTMLVAMSLLIPIDKHKRRHSLTKERRRTIRLAVENGARWTLGHFLKASGQTINEYTFESFASWYSSGGYNVAPWLELLDLNKVMSLIAEPAGPLELPPLDNGRGFMSSERRSSRDRVSSLRRHHSSRRGPPPEILFTFPLGSRRSLVVLKEDAAYVRNVVEQLGLLSMKPDDVWKALQSAVEKRRSKPLMPNEPAIYVNTATFVQCMQEICSKSSRKRPASSIHTSSSLDEILSNFFQCFDIDQCDSVALDELMGGLTLLCGGKKSTKLSFAFSVFDTRPGVHAPGASNNITHSLSGEDLFLFLRSILIVTFSICRQSLDLTDDMVGRCIADTANMICNDVMRHQWETKRADRLDFDEFGQWYNDGGFERAPWLELLDLKKWVLVYDLDSHEQVASSRATKTAPAIAPVPSREQDISIPAQNNFTPPPPPEDALDHSFFDPDAIMHMDSVSN